MSRKRQLVSHFGVEGKQIIRVSFEKELLYPKLMLGMVSLQINGTLGRKHGTCHPYPEKTNKKMINFFGCFHL